MCALRISDLAELHVYSFSQVSHELSMATFLAQDNSWGAGQASTACRRGSVIWQLPGTKASAMAGCRPAHNVPS